MTSFPSPPSASSAPALVQMTSSRVVPLSESSAAVPTIVQSFRAPATLLSTPCANAGPTMRPTVATDTTMARSLMVPSSPRPPDEAVVGRQEHIPEASRPHEGATTGGPAPEGPRPKSGNGERVRTGRGHAEGPRLPPRPFRDFWSEPSYCSQLVTTSPASITQVSVLFPPSSASFPETLSRDLRKSLPFSPCSCPLKPS